MKFILLTVLACAVMLSSAAVQTKRPKQPKKTVRSSAKIVYEPDAELLKTMREKASVVESKQDWMEIDRQTPFANPSKTRAAYVARFKTANEPNAMLDVVVQDAATNKFYEIRGIEDFPWRPFTDFKWISNDVLQFEQWVNPNNGGRYQVNLKTGKVVAAGYVRSN